MINSVMKLTSEPPLPILAGHIIPGVPRALTEQEKYIIFSKAYNRTLINMLAISVGLLTAGFYVNAKANQANIIFAARLVVILGSASTLGTVLAPSRYAYKAVAKATANAAAAHQPT